jgi:hypothetical protein
MSEQQIVQLPTFYELTLPLLQLANSKKIVTDEFAEQFLAEHFKIPQEVVQLLKANGKERKFLNKIRWAKTHLKMANLIKKSGKAKFAITRRGKEVLEINPDRITEKFLSRFDEYKKSRGLSIKFERRWAMPSKWTFQIEPIEELLDTEIQGITVDPFCGQSKIADIRNDVNPKSDSQSHMDALEFLKLQRTESADTVLNDGIYSPTQQKRTYDELGLKLTNYMTSGGYPASIKDQIARITKLGGKVISFGWNSNGMGKGRGFSLEKILLVPHGGNHHDTIVIVERRVDRIVS